jgi:hypothetical protein
MAKAARLEIATGKATLPGLFHQLVSRREEAGRTSCERLWLQDRARSLHNEALARSHSKRKANGKVVAARKRRKEALVEEYLAFSSRKARRHF